MAISLRPKEGTQRQVCGAGPSYLKKAGIWNAQIIQQMNRLFAATGFVPKKDIRGIILNRWGHAFVHHSLAFSSTQPLVQRQETQ